MSIYGAGGWAPPGPWRLQRVDQGQDFEIPINHYIQAPGRGHCVYHLNDAQFPNGFGSPYAVVKIKSGPFAVGDGLWYIGHCNEDVLPVGKHFRFGHKLAKANHFLNSGWGWAEIGKCINGYPGPMGTGAKYAHLFRDRRRIGLYERH